MSETGFLESTDRADVDTGLRAAFLAFEADGRLDLALPGSGYTDLRWQSLAALSRHNTVLGRWSEAHTDAIAILHELDGPTPQRGQIWGVWAAEPPAPILEAVPGDSGWVLTGTKPWCSGASLCTHALVTARVEGSPRLFAVDLTHPGATPVPNTWHAVGMSESDSGSVAFDRVPAVAVGGPTDYLTRPGFWHGAIGVSAAWFGSACAVADTLHAAVRDRPDPHRTAHLGAIAAALGAASSALTTAAAEVDADPFDRSGRARTRARIVRAVVEDAATQCIDRVGRALGAGPLCSDSQHARRVADLTVYLRQSHAERDLEALGHDIAEEDNPW
ncbi:Acyl-CoA dehydrogenase/oxidase domain protein [Rhodococcus sp. B7740]|uniref:acyl-CoA dehydrogenase family protein n=1 Tax=Rhodococcus sp. B7740 TaxID=1564114 RepID=UPI0005D82D40|nr:acyl-CoA dehydrogenase family protein [Rhodococcus sp. B7740]AJW41359.1 Acyl-CoA dehydrogenase/oxidase domain protein [Rhodococcus sp. B7740]